MIEEVKAIAGFKGDPRVKPRSTRHAAETRLMRNGADIRSIQAWLGHGQLQPGAVPAYLHTDQQQVRKNARLAALGPPPPDSEPPRPASERAAFHRRRQAVPSERHDAHSAAISPVDHVFLLRAGRRQDYDSARLSRPMQLEPMPEYARRVRLCLASI
jgi:hypothetical protein